MADRIELALGHAPWRPTTASELLATYRYYDGPLTGVVSQHGNDYFFSCLDGEADTLSLWFYVPIKREQRERLEAMSPEEFAQAYRHEPLEGCMVLALATERLGIVDFEAVEDCEDDRVVEAGMRHALQALRQRLVELGDDASHLDLTLV
jgi:hypothetical protein